jgi:hypothetical protein
VEKQARAYLPILKGLAVHPVLEMINSCKHGRDTYYNSTPPGR